MEYYEPRFWGLDPVFSATIKLNITDVFSLNPHPSVPEVYCILNHPVQSVHIMGDVVSIQKKSRMVKYDVDDGTGVISCTQWYLEEDNETGIFIPKLGELVAVWGKISEFREQKQLTVMTIATQNDPNAEPLHWLEIAYLKKTVYSRPFLLPPSVSVGSLSEISLRDSTREAVMGYLNECFRGRTGKHFTLPQLCADMELHRRCVVMTGGGVGMEQVIAALTRTVRELPEKGVLIPAIGVGKHRETKYELFFPKQHLCPMIVEYIRWKEKTLESVARLGVPEDWIIKFIKQKEVFCKVPEAAILKAIEQLVGDSLVYLFSTKSYKTVT